jgi:(p)ppGpp synthase/HD superfamily hydrolase
MGERIEAAEGFARRAHATQVDKAGQPYVAHLARVAGLLALRFPHASEAEFEAAWLHDVLEDTATTPAELRAAGISETAIGIIGELTKPDGMEYLDWIGRLAGSGSLGAIRVKLADNEDNRDPERVAALEGGAELVERRYAPARAVLMAALEARTSERQA